MLGGRSDESPFLMSNIQTVDGINVMHLNQMGDLVGEDTKRDLPNAFYSFAHCYISGHLPSNYLLAF